MARIFQQAWTQKVQEMIAKAAETGSSTRDLVREIVAYLESVGVNVKLLPRLQRTVEYQLLISYSRRRRETLNTPTMLDFFPYRQWLTQGNGTPGVNGVRPSHAFLHAKVFRSDDPMWVYCHPPEWAWGCRCLYRALMESQVVEMRAVIWTYANGMILPSPIQLTGQVGKQQEASIRVRPGRNIAEAGTEFYLAELSRKLRAAVEGTLKE